MKKVLFVIAIGMTAIGLITANDHKGIIAIGPIPTCGPTDPPCPDAVK